MGQCKLNGVDVNTEGEYGLQIVLYTLYFITKFKKELLPVTTAVCPPPPVTYLIEG